MIGGFITIFLERSDMNWYDARPLTVSMWPVIILGVAFVAIVQGAALLAEHFTDWMFKKLNVKK